MQRLNSRLDRMTINASMSVHQSLCSGKGFMNKTKLYLLIVELMLLGGNIILELIKIRRAR
jgi:hypothetical protein